MKISQTKNDFKHKIKPATIFFHALIKTKCCGIFPRQTNKTRKKHTPRMTQHGPKTSHAGPNMAARRPRMDQKSLKTIGKLRFLFLEHQEGKI